MIKDKKLMKFISGLGTTACCLLAAGFLFAAAPMTAHAVPLGSNPGGASTNTDEGAAGDDAEAGGAEDTGDTGNEGAGEAAGGSVTSATVTSGSVNVRSEASTDASVAGKATQGMEVTVTGETQGSDGKTWYAVSFESNGSTVTGYIRSDLVEAHVAEPEPAPEEPAPQETETPEEQPAAPTEEYGVVYEDDGTGTSYWYLHDNTMGTKYKVEDLLNAEKTNQSNMDAMEKTTSSMRLVIIIMAVVILVLIVVVTVFIIKLKNAYEGADYDGYDDDDEDDEEEEDDEDEDEEERPRRRSFGPRFASRRDREEEEDEDEEEDDEDDDYEEERPRRKASRSKEKGWQSKNFLDDDDLEFEFLDLK